MAIIKSNMVTMRIKKNLLQNKKGAATDYTQLRVFSTITAIECSALEIAF
jgi:hypothetical protein